MTRGTTRLLCALTALASASVLASGTAAAHGTALSEFRAPLPFSYLLVGAGGTIVATALLLGYVGRAPRWRVPIRELSERTVDRLRRLAGLVFLLAIVVAVVHGVVGRQTQTANVATVFVWPVWIMGVALVAIVAGSPWRVLSPWRTIYSGLCRLEGEDVGGRDLPESVGVWPAVFGFVLLIGYAENLTTVIRSPAGTAGVIGVYGVAMVAGSLVFGRAWFRRADPLEVFYDLLGRTAVVGYEDRSGGTAIVLRPPWVATSRPVATGGHAALAVAAVFTLSFDGFVETQPFQDVVFGVRSVLSTGAWTPVLLYLVGLVAFLAMYVTVARLTANAGRFDSPVTTLAGTVIPIAAAYQVAHTYPFVFWNVGRLPTFMGGHAVDTIGWLSVPAFWGSQVALIVAGHIVAVGATHTALDRQLTDDRGRLIAHVPLVVLMVAYTVLSLWIISQPVLG